MTRVCIELDGDGSIGPSVKTYSTVIGDGSQSDFAIDHDLNSQSVFINAYDANTGARVEDYGVAFTNANRATLTFDTVPAANSVKVQVIAVIPAV